MTDENKLDERERSLKERLAAISELEAQIKDKEKKLKARESARKQIALRLSPTLLEELTRWAEDDFRSVNGQIEYILTEAVRNRRKKQM